MSLTLERTAWDRLSRSDEDLPGVPVAIGDFLPEVLESLLANPQPDARAEVLRVPPPRGRTGRAMRLVG